VLGYENNTVTRLRARDGAFQGSFPAVISGSAIAFDQRNIWITTDAFNGRVTRIRPDDPTKRNTYSTGPYPIRILYTAGSVWVSTEQNGVIKITPAE
jgi:hypothetical protein